eukprot:c14740_g1_i1.p1 GENE.c14740_g1_i1~~c14740_g1_i1.p1  ORF type:complete len:232 (+),score=33.07 c14740_g1_i1:323-1018(+)
MRRMVTCSATSITTRLSSMFCARLYPTDPTCPLDAMIRPTHSGKTWSFSERLGEFLEEKGSPNQVFLAKFSFLAGIPEHRPFAKPGLPLKMKFWLQILFLQMVWAAAIKDNNPDGPCIGYDSSVRRAFREYGFFNSMWGGIQGCEGLAENFPELVEEFCASPTHPQHLLFPMTIRAIELVEQGLMPGNVTIWQGCCVCRTVKLDGVPPVVTVGLAAVLFTLVAVPVWLAMM